MNAVVEQLSAPSLRPEWERIELLAYSLGQERQGKTLPEALLERLKQLQGEVERLRRHANSPWRALASEAWEPMAYDLAALALGPEIEPRIGWLYQQLQAGTQHSYPSVALVRELLALDESETRDLLGCLEEDSLLRRVQVIRAEGQGWHAVLVAGPGMTARLMGWPEPQTAPPGATRVWQAARWEDLILPAEVMTQLHEFLYWIEQRDTVGRQWGGEVGGGPLALFCGPSGTGKTFAAAVIANQLGWPLYRVDLGRLVSKYIGETEKNLNRLF
ncbi:MAG: ATP-binding protein, partial [Sulfurimicrobium sp.]|nr:ATP-binding protein [Sulfurimicrobium sp.]